MGRKNHCDRYKGHIHPQNLSFKTRLTKISGSNPLRFWRNSASQPESQLGFYLQETKPNLTRTNNLRDQYNTINHHRPPNIKQQNLTRILTHAFSLSFTLHHSHTFFHWDTSWNMSNCNYIWCQDRTGSFINTTATRGPSITKLPVHPEAAVNSNMQHS